MRGLSEGIGGGVIWLLLFASGIGALVVFIKSLFNRSDDEGID